MTQKRLDGKQALITGASKGIGKGLARVFLQQGADVFLNARNEATLARTAEQLREELPEAGSIETFAADVANADEAQRLAELVCERFDSLNVLVNNASVLGKKTPIADLDNETWDEVLRVNTSSLLYITRPLIPILVKNRGSIINVSSTVGRIGKPMWGAYAVSKFGLEGFTQVLAAELADNGVRVNSVNPGATRTDMRAAAYPNEDPLSLPTAEEISEIFVRLASDETTLNGETFEARDYSTAPAG